MSPVLSIILILAAAVAGFFIGRWHGLSTGSKELTNELESKDKELNDLKQGVNQHFDETARLFSNLTEEYKTLYQHLATGATTLSDKDFKLKLSAPVGADALSNDPADRSEAKANDVIDSEESLAESTITQDDADSKHEEESFINPNSSDASDDKDDKDDNDKLKDSDLAANTPKADDAIAEATSSETAQPEIDKEITAPKDWADDDMDDNYTPNTDTSKKPKNKRSQAEQSSDAESGTKDSTDHQTEKTKAKNKQ